MLRSQPFQGSVVCQEHVAKHRFRGWQQGLGQPREVSVTPVHSDLLVFSLDQRTLYGRYKVKVRQDRTGLIGYRELEMSDEPCPALPPRPRRGVCV